NIPVNKLKPFDENPYKVQDNDEMNSLITSIQDIGIAEPILVRPIENTDEYEVISGHRRLHAAEKAGLTTVPALIYAISRDEAVVMLVDSNLHREHILPSEKAFAYKLKMEALNSRGCRSDLTSSQVATKLDSAAEIGKESGESRDTVFRYIRLTYLIPQLLDLMDENKIAFSVGVELSYLDDQSQFDVLEQCEQNDCTPSYSQAVRMHKAINDGTLDKDFIIEIMSEEKANQRETYRIPAERLRGKIPSSYTAQQREDYIVKAVEYYQKYLQRQRETGR
ncbi:MAG: ParB/RepB/Spo0J family partition protein, partial [Bacteroidales bacterium]|nr:ParB/RepB/Spo0J family partition protein [Bacteroidales bacterium]